MSSVPFKPETDIQVRLRVSSELYDAYEEQAKELNLSPEDLMEARLKLALEITDTKPIYLSPEDRHELDEALGRNLSNSTELIRAVKNALSIKISDKPNSATLIKLKPNLVSRLRSRCFESSFESFLSRITIEELERYCGLR